MLAGLEEALRPQSARNPEEMTPTKTLIETLIEGLFDYAGLYPPASLSLLSAVNNYLEYRGSRHASVLGRFIINLDRLDELRLVMADSFEKITLSVIATGDLDPDALAEQVRTAPNIDAVEVKCNNVEDVTRMTSRIPRPLTTYFEVPMNSDGRAALQAISAAGARAKIRMGGVVPGAIPSIPEVAETLRELAQLRLPFKATAGLHHPVRSNRPLTYQPQGPSGTMHGFINLACAAAILFFGGDLGIAQFALEEQNPTAWTITADRLRWRDLNWTTDQLATLRQEFLISIGSCSFEEPIHDLQSLGGYEELG
jgi:hypothetical protein